MKKINILLSILLFVSYVALADNEGKLRAANWCFGNTAMIDFTSGAPVSKKGSNLFTLEGVATMSDTGGNLLLYTDGKIVYNKNHYTMANGTGLLGDASSSQSAIIFPVPGDTNKYYIATVDVVWQTGTESPNTSHKGKNYSIVDMTKNNGLGEVITKNIKLSPLVCEKATAVGHGNGIDYWLVTQVWKNNIIQVFLVNEKGITLKHEFKSTIFNSWYYTGDSKGYIKFSADATMLASANHNVGLFLYDFNNVTGELSNERGWRNDEFTNSYGVEFSPSGRFLYVSSVRLGGNHSNNLNAYLFQLDLWAGTNKDIENSSAIIYKETNATVNPFGALQLAIDGKIYVARNSNVYLGTINNVESKGSACNYDHQGFRIQYGYSFIGLPQSIQSFYVQTPKNTVTYDACEGENIVLSAEYLDGYSYRWTGPKDLDIDTCYHVITPAKLNDSGKYILTVTLPNTLTKTFEFDITVKYTDFDVELIDKSNLTSNKNAKSNARYFSIKNNAPFDMLITNAYLKNGDKFKLNPVALPLTITANTTSTTDISYYLFSDYTGLFDDSLIVEVAEPCTDSAASYIKGMVTAQTKATAMTDDCEGGTLVLDVEENNEYAYNWTGPLGLDVDTAHYEINPTTLAHSGTYTLTVTAPDGTKKTLDYKIIIKTLDLETELIKPKSDTVAVYQKSENYFFKITNKSDFDAVVSNVRLKNGTKFKLNTPQLPITIPAHDEITNEISCYLAASDDAGTFDDSLLVKISEPCKANLGDKVSLNVEPLILYVHLPDTTAEVGQVVRIPLKVRLNHQLGSKSLADINLTWHYLANLYSPMYYQTFEKQILYDKNIDLENEYMSGHFKDIALDTTYQRIAYISGYALLSKLNSTPLAFNVDSAQSNVSISGLIIVPENGSLTVTKPVCISPDIVMNPDITHAASPVMMPISNDATIKLYSPDAGELKLTVYSINGQIVEQFSYINGDAPLYKEIALDLNKYSNGVYCLTWQSKQRTFNKTLVIAK